MFELRRKFRFDSAHTLEREVETVSSRRIHGHSYIAEIAIQGTPDPATGMIVDLGLLDSRLAAIRAALDHHYLNDVPGLGPATIENLAAWIWRALLPNCPGLARVTVYRESSGDSCSYAGPQRRA
jgi:6-pyruvoyltetrahydropterin/6-carboxytetrahydropterin synthase